MASNKNIKSTAEQARTKRKTQDSKLIGKTGENYVIQYEKEKLKKMYQKKNLKEHILSRPDTYMGGVTNEETEQYIHDMEFEDEDEPGGCSKTKHFVKRKFEYNPGHKSITEEIIINAFDNKSRVDQRNNDGKLKGKNRLIPVSYIKINVDRKKPEIIVENDGEGIDIVEHPSEFKENGKPFYIPTKQRRGLGLVSRFLKIVFCYLF